MVPTTVFDTYWRFATERQAALHRRLRGDAAPWTNDPILNAHRFTNVYRVSDRVSQYLIREIQYRDDRSQTPQEVFFRTMMFKIFNRVETWEAIEKSLGPLSWTSVDLNAVGAVLDERQDRGVRNYSAAYIMPSPPLGHRRKHTNHLALLAQMMYDRVPDRIHQAPSLSAVYETLLAYPGLGPFLSFQYAIDLNYSDLLDFDENDFVVAGPGALDGISKCFSDVSSRSPEQIIQRMVERQDIEFARLGLAFEPLMGRNLHLIDCQNLFCEVSKYARIAHPDITGTSGRKRIKQSYRSDPEPLAPIALPRRWQNDHENKL